MVTRDKIIGMFLGVGVGDALGRPVEGMTHEEVIRTFGHIARYIVPDGWPADRKVGTTTDDTQLLLAVAEGLLASGGKPDMDAQVHAHVNAFNESTQGWGSSTFGAVRRLAQGVPWRNAGARGGRISGTGTGCIMKLAGTALLLVEQVQGAAEFIADLVSMTHQTSVAVSAGLAHAAGLAYCLQVEPAKFVPAEFVKIVVDASRRGRTYFPETLTDEDITERLALCRDYADWLPERCVAEMENGRNYVYHALPYALMFFLRQPSSVEALFEVVSCGGDADTLGSLCGSLLGGLNGTAVFSPHLVHDLDATDRLIETANRLCDVFGIMESGVARRLLHVVQADFAEPIGDHDFGISEYLLGGLLSQVANRQHGYITGAYVPAPDAAAFADAIEKIKQTQGWELAMTINGDPSGEGVTAFCAWLRQDAFEMVEDRENVGETT